mgnify:CR=1 FL=1
MCSIYSGNSFTSLSMLIKKPLGISFVNNKISFIFLATHCSKPCMFQEWKFIRGYCVINLNFSTNKLRIFYLLAYATFPYFVQGSVNTWLYTVNKHLILIVTQRIKLITAYLRHIPFLKIIRCYFKLVANIQWFAHIRYKKEAKK